MDKKNKDFVYDRKTGQKYILIEDSLESTIGLNNNKESVILNKDNIIKETELKRFKDILKILFKNGDLQIFQDIDYSYGKSYMEDGFRITPKTKYLTTNVYLENKQVLKNKIKIER